MTIPPLLWECNGMIVNTKTTIGNNPRHSEKLRNLSSHSRRVGVLTEPVTTTEYNVRNQITTQNWPCKSPFNFLDRSLMKALTGSFKKGLDRSHTSGLNRRSPKVLTGNSKNAPDTSPKEALTGSFKTGLDNSQISGLNRRPTKVPTGDFKNSPDSCL